jgi:Polysaccharide deacetylase
VNGIFCISLDFELHWGGFEKWPLSNYPIPNSNLDALDQYFINTRWAIPQMVKAFEESRVQATWATVGLLFHRDKASLLKNMPVLKPTYESSELSPYGFMDRYGIGESEEVDPFHYAHSLLTEISRTEYQEIGSHTFGHFYCNEAGQTVDQFRDDLMAAQQAASAFGIKLKSLVFPRNQFNDDYLKVCYACGFASVRSNPTDWFWKINTRDEGVLKRLARGADAYVAGVGKKNSYPISQVDVRAGFPLCIPASRLLRPYRASEGFLNQWKISRIKKEMTVAAELGEVYHLWWHPHNFGSYPKQSLEGLNQLLEHFDQLRGKFGMQSLSMNAIAQLISDHARATPA